MRAARRLAWPISMSRRARKGKAVNPAQKPVFLLCWLINKFTNEGDTIVDGFAGTGPTNVCLNVCLCVLDGEGVIIVPHKLRWRIKSINKIIHPPDNVFDLYRIILHRHHVPLHQYRRDDARACI